MTTFSFPIVERAFVHKVWYDNKEGYHFLVSYVIDVNGTETTMEVLPTTLEKLMELPLIDLDTPIQVMEQSGSITRCVLVTSVRELSLTE